MPWLMLVLKIPKAGNITGHVRIRSKVQGIALSLSDICVLLTTHLLDGAGIHTLSLTAGGGCQPVMAMVPYFTTK
jgi:hypothetical protein